MRVLELGDEGARPFHLRLHPHFTVVRGLTGCRRVAVLEALSGIARGDAGHFTGVIELAGTLSELDGERLATLDLPSDVDAVVRAGDLPGPYREATRPPDGQQAMLTCDEAARALREAKMAVAAAEEAARAASVELDTLRNAAPAEPAALNAPAEEPTSEAAATRAFGLADEWADLHPARRAPETESEAVRSARRRFEAAALAAAEAEAAMQVQVPSLRADEVARLEAAHAQVLDAESRAESFLGGRRAQRRLAEAREAERVVLDGLGLSTYADYMMSLSSQGLAPARRAVFETARLTVMSAAAAWAAVEYGSLDARRRRQLAERVEQALNDVSDRPLTDRLAVDDLRAALVDVGIGVAVDRLDRTELVAMAESWLAERRQLDEHPPIAGDENEPVAVIELGPVSGGPPPPGADRDAAPTAEVERLTAEVERLTVEIERRSAEVERLSSELTVAEAAVDEALDAERLARDAPPPDVDQEGLVDEIEWYLLGRLAAQRQVSVAGSVPIVLDDPFRGVKPDDTVRLLSHLERLSTAVQVVVITDDVTIVAWADQLGSERATLVDLAV